ncbi:hypothetical protein AAFF_G00262540 [Aldrovandia affinis]|uniref:Gypsy retrotransposon integrase-like protein 1 n=1 Tax=Aldrovandia affinis TaxID=143900 RepID=A0AAD7WSQ0_9TELE|nr:hypothetical protein AAFF_G00262540 [Aldrovandia affinis]
MHVGFRRDVFQKLQEHGLKLQPRKCHLFQKEVLYLGHIVSQQGVATDLEKTAAVQAWPVPSTNSQVRSFLGFAGYYRRFIPRFSKVTSPLNALLQGNARSSNQNADALSRLPEEATVAAVQVDSSPSPDGGDNGDTGVGAASGNHWQQWQLEDAELCQLHEWKTQDEPPPVCGRSTLPTQMRRLLQEWDQLVIHNGILMHQAVEQDTGDPISQWVVLAMRKQEVWREYHRGAGHASAEKLLTMLQRRFFWPGMGQDLKAWTAECPECVVSKAGSESSPPSMSHYVLLHSLPVGRLAPAPTVEPANHIPEPANRGLDSQELGVIWVFPSSLYP